MTTLLALLVLSITPADAGKLRDDAGFKGIPFGPATVVDKPPFDICVPEPEENVRWSCVTTVAGQTGMVSYLVNEGYFVGVMGVFQGYIECNDLVSSLDAAWGPHTQSNPYIETYVWADLPMVAIWDWNQFTNACTLSIAHTVLFEKAKQLRAARAAEQAHDL